MKDISYTQKHINDIVSTAEKVLLDSNNTTLQSILDTQVLTDLAKKVLMEQIDINKNAVEVIRSGQHAALYTNLYEIDDERWN